MIWCIVEIAFQFPSGGRDRSRSRRQNDWGDKGGGLVTSFQLNHSTTRDLSKSSGRSGRKKGR